MPRALWRHRDACCRAASPGPERGARHGLRAATRAGGGTLPAVASRPGGFTRIVGPVLLALACAGVATGCRHQPIPPSYPGGVAPAVSELLRAAEPELAAVAVPRAKIRLGAHRGALAYLAEQPGRVRGSVTIAGNELVSLSVHERGYQLVYKLDGLPQGYYEGPAPGDCAVAALVGVALTPRMLARLLLGGAPVPEDARPVDQAWDPKRGAERLTLRSAAVEQDLWFRAVGGGWRFVRAATWARGPSGRGELVWSVELSDWGRFGGRELARELRLERHDLRRAPAARITLQEVETAPPWAEPERSPTKDGEGGGATGGDGDPEDTGGWDDGGAWENDEGWENEGEGAQAPPKDTPSAQGQQGATGAPARAEPDRDAPPPAATASPDADASERESELPPVWRLPVPEGLPHRGDLCARRGR